MPTHAFNDAFSNPRPLFRIENGRLQDDRTLDGQLNFRILGQLAGILWNEYAIAIDRSNGGSHVHVLLASPSFVLS